MLHWTDETDREADVFFATLPEREIRQRQDLCREQIGMAHAQGNTNALTDLRRMEDALARSMMARLSVPASEGERALEKAKAFVRGEVRGRCCDNMPECSHVFEAVTEEPWVRP